MATKEENEATRTENLENLLAEMNHLKELVGRICDSDPATRERAVHIQSAIMVSKDVTYRLTLAMTYNAFEESDNFHEARYPCGGLAPEEP